MQQARSTHQRTNIGTLSAIIALTSLLSAPHAQALTWNKPVESLQGLTPSHRAFEITPFAINPLQPRGLSLYGLGKVEFVDAIRSVMHERLNSPFINIRSEETPVSFNLSGSMRTHEFKFYVGDVPLCGLEVRAHEFADRSTLTLGSLPDLDSQATPPNNDWPDRDLAMEKAADALVKQSGSRSPVKMKYAQRCYQANNGSLLPVWNLTLVQDDLPYQAYADAYETLALERGYFDVTGSARVYPWNSYAGEPLTDFDLPNLLGDNTLTSDLIRIYVPSSYTRAVGVNNVFNFSPGSEGFAQASAYSHVQEHEKYFSDLGFEWYGPKPLEVQLHVKPNGKSNNALFIPGSSGAGTVPTIQVDDGDGDGLQNLCYDGDVVSHEFGHHVIYKTLRSTSGESLVLHEGLADFFAFMRSGDACLGESICPAQGKLCYVPGRCLRTADNDITYKGKEWNDWAGTENRLGHLHGQLISGLLWDLRRSKEVPAGDLAHLVFSTALLFQNSSGFRDFVIALFTADRKFYDAKYMTAIRAAISNRGMDEFLKDIPEDATSPLPDLSTDGNSDDNDSITNDSTTTVTSTTKKKKSSPFSCGVVADTGADTQNMQLLLLGILLAPGLVLSRKLIAKPAIIKRRKNQKQNDK